MPPRMPRAWAVALVLAGAFLGRASAEFVVLDPQDFKDHFVEGWPGPYSNGTGAGHVNQSTFDWAAGNVPFFECSDPDITAAYYFRWKTYKSHIIPTDWPDVPYVVSEFGGSVHWGGPYGAINAAAGHHIMEGRWIRDPAPMDSLIRFWVSSLAGDGGAGWGAHFANGTAGERGSTPYSTWILTAAAKRMRVKGDASLGRLLNGSDVPFASVFEAMERWWIARTQQTRLDCAIAPRSGAGSRPTCATDAPLAHPRTAPFCYIVADGWDAMEGSISGAGCRPTVGAMKFGDARALAEMAAHALPPAGVPAANASAIAAAWAQRAEWIREEYLRLLWSDTLQFFAVYKENLQNNGNYKCQWPPNATVAADNLPGCPPLWPCNATVAVRELLALGSPWYFGVVPPAAGGATSKYEAAWAQLFDAQGGFWGEWGPTTAERRHRCFNQSQDQAECNWAGPSWPYETSRVLTGLAELLIEYPPEQGRSAGMGPPQFTRLLQTYARSMTLSTAANGSTPWVGENIEPDRGYWVAREIMYAGGAHPAPVDCAACKADPRPRNCGGRTAYEQLPCCGAAPGSAASCDGKILPTVDKDRGKDYNHATFCDVVVSALVGVRPQWGDTFSLAPLADNYTISYFALDNVLLHGRNVSVTYDPSGARAGYRGCKGLCVYLDGRMVAQSPVLARLDNISLARAP